MNLYYDFTEILIKVLILIIPILIRVAFVTLLERKILRIQINRKGPDKVSFKGLIQPISDALKLATKASNYNSNMSLMLYYIAVGLIFTLSMMMWSFYFNVQSTVSWKLSFLSMIIIIGVMTMKSILSGWRTFGKYPVIGRIRTVSQIISYEAVIYIIFISIIWNLKRFSIIELSLQQIRIIALLQPLLLFMWIPSLIAELNRTPYDFSEGERELVRGFNTEFGSSGFTLIFLREYRNIIFFMTMTTAIFFQNSFTISFLIIRSIIIFLIIWIRRSLPRLRLDQFINLAWKFFIPFTTTIIIINISHF